MQGALSCKPCLVPDGAFYTASIDMASRPYLYRIRFFPEATFRFWKICRGWVNSLG
jgi:hypothetical protein